MAASAPFGTDNGSASNSGTYECNICLDAAKDPVVSMCGHLFCWSCLYRWMDTQVHDRGQAACPVCKAAIDRERVVPLYGRGGNTRDPRNDNSPPRPRPQRTEVPDHEVPFFGDNVFGHSAGGFHFSFGVATFPFRVLHTNLNIAGRPNDASQQAVNNRSIEDLLSNIFLYLGILLMLGVIFAE